MQAICFTVSNGGQWICNLTRVGAAAPLEGLAPGEWACFERALVVRDIFTGGVRTFLSREDAQAFRAQIYAQHGASCVGARWCHACYMSREWFLARLMASLARAACYAIKSMYHVNHLLLHVCVWPTRASCACDFCPRPGPSRMHALAGT